MICSSCHVLFRMQKYDKIVIPTSFILIRLHPSVLQSCGVDFRKQLVLAFDWPMM